MGRNSESLTDLAHPGNVRGDRTESSGRLSEVVHIADADVGSERSKMIEIRDYSDFMPVPDSDGDDMERAKRNSWERVPGVDVTATMVTSSSGSVVACVPAKTGSNSAGNVALFHSRRRKLLVERGDIRWCY